MAGENPAQSAAMVGARGKLFGMQLNDGHTRLAAEDGLIFGSVHRSMALELMLWASGCTSTPSRATRTRLRRRHVEHDMCSAPSSTLRSETVPAQPITSRRVISDTRSPKVLLTARAVSLLEVESVIGTESSIDFGGVGMPDSAVLLGAADSTHVTLPWRSSWT